MQQCIHILPFTHILPFIHIFLPPFGHYQNKDRFGNYKFTYDFSRKRKYAKQVCKPESICKTKLE